MGLVAPTHGDGYTPGHGVMGVTCNITLEHYEPDNGVVDAIAWNPE
jgi:hypothetical protein